MSEQMLAKVREIASLAEGASEAMQSAERPSVEDAGIAFVCAEEILDIARAWELDLLADLVRPEAANSCSAG